MPFRYLDHTADAGIEATGTTLEEAFDETARAMFGLMVKADEAVPEKDVTIEARAASLDELLVEFLNELLAQQGLHGLIFTGCRVSEIAPERDGGYVLRATASGAKPEALEGKLGQEVKAASYLALKVEGKPGNYTVRCVLDM
jgi:SHS2 domain-containing protein